MGRSGERRESFERHDSIYSSGMARKAPAADRGIRVARRLWPGLQRGISVTAMDVTVIAFLALLAAVAALRIVELQISRRHQASMIERGASKVAEPRFGWMVALHTAVLVGAAVEVIFLHRPFIPMLAAVMFVIFLAANAVRWWVIRTLGEHWNVQVMDSTRLGVITTGPFRFVRHPNYAAVMLELFALPLIHTAWATAVIGSALHAWVLSRRLAVEEPTLLADPVYREVMAGKPRFLPGIF